MSRRISRLAAPYQVVFVMALLLTGCGSVPQRAATVPSSPSSPPGTPAATAGSSRPQAGTDPTAAPTAAVASLADGTLPPGSPLPSEATCAARVHRSTWEPRPDNQAANNSEPTAAQLAGIGTWGPAMGLDSRADSLRQQMTGDFTGTTDEILQWVACKWGFNPNIVRAQAVVESYWHQSQQGDWTTDRSYCPPGTWNGSGCYQSYGMLQIKWYYFQDTWPMSKDDTAFNVEFVYAMLRACYEGWTTYLLQGTPLPGYKPYAAGDLWGCLGRWYSGWWYTSAAVGYIKAVKAALSAKEWLAPGF